MRENSPNFSYYFSNLKSVFLQSLHHSWVSWETSLSCKFICFGQKEPIKVQIFRLSTTHIKIHRTSRHFSFMSNFSFKFHITLQCHHIKLLYDFLAEIFFRKKESIKVRIFSALSSQVKVHQILHVIFGTAVHFFFKFCIAL